MAAAPLQTVSTVDALEQALEERIVGGELVPGEHLRESDLAAEYEVARHSLRAACDALVRKGLLVKRPNRGFFVPELTNEDAKEIFEFRRALELSAVRTLAERRHVPPATLEAVAVLQQLPDDAPWQHIIRADLDYHRSLVEAVGNGRLARAHADLLGEIGLFLAQIGASYENPAGVAREHERLVKAIESGDPDRAEHELDLHFADGQRRLR